MKILFMTILLLLNVAHAGDVNSAYDLICKPMTFESERNACFERIRNHKYFDNTALKICSVVTFDSAKLYCLDIIADKYYDAFEIDKCASQPYESVRMDCLKYSGRVNDPNRSTCIQREEALAELNTALRFLRTGNPRGTEQKLLNLLARFNSCNP